MQTKIKNFLRPTAFKVIIAIVIASLRLIPNINPNNSLNGIIFFLWNKMSDIILLATQQILGYDLFTKYYFLNYFSLILFFFYCYILASLLSALIKLLKIKK
ncbi:MAG: hypothetical protein Q8N55_04475 [bacterium]|nr:hypothetical protein [bacterium]